LGGAVTLEVDHLPAVDDRDDTPGRVGLVVRGEQRVDPVGELGPDGDLARVLARRRRRQQNAEGTRA
jgi:hypothetical protein